jgi:hypothetical protein
MAYNFKIPMPWTDMLRGSIAETLTPYFQNSSALEEVRISIIRQGLPPNLRAHQHEIDVVQVFDVMRDEGIPLAPAPRAEVALELLRAPDASARRRTLEHRALEIAEDCSEVFSRHRQGDLGEFAEQGAEALRRGLPGPAQAMFTATASTVVDRMELGSDPGWRAARRIGPKELREVSSAPPPELTSLPSYEYWVAAPLWHAFPSAPFDDGAEIPDRWSRNASTHAVSGVHYTVPNAVIAMLFVAALLDFTDLAETDPSADE